MNAQEIIVGIIVLGCILGVVKRIVRYIKQVQQNKTCCTCDGCNQCPLSSQCSDNKKQHFK